MFHGRPRMGRQVWRLQPPAFAAIINCKRCVVRNSCQRFLKSAYGLDTRNLRSHFFLLCATFSTIIGNYDLVNFKNSSSERIATPNFLAAASLEPASEPATT